MGKIKDDGPDDPVWVSRRVFCAICNKKWVATYRTDAPGLECPECGYMNSIIEAIF